MSDYYKFALINKLADQRERIMLAFDWMNIEASDDQSFRDFLDALESAMNTVGFYGSQNISKINQRSKKKGLLGILVNALHFNDMAVSYCEANEAESALDWMMLCENRIDAFFNFQNQHLRNQDKALKAINARHENGYNAQAKEIIAYWRQHIDNKLSAPKAADELSRIFKGVEHRTLEEYVRKAKKE